MSDTGTFISTGCSIKNEYFKVFQHRPVPVVATSKEWKKDGRMERLYSRGYFHYFIVVWLRWGLDNFEKIKKRKKRFSLLEVAF